jgi:hypothetical protein
MDGRKFFIQLGNNQLLNKDSYGDEAFRERPPSLEHTDRWVGAGVGKPDREGHDST